MWSSMFPLPNRPRSILLTAESLKDWSWEDEGKPPCFSRSCLCRSSVLKTEASVMASIMPCGKPPDFNSLTLRIKLSKNPVYQSMPGETAAAAAKNFRRVRKTVGDPSTLANAFLRV
jgi:hypothetical protein